MYGSFYEKDNDSELFTQYKEENYIFKLDSEYNVEGQNYVSNRIWVDLVYYKDQHFIFKYQDDEHQYFQTLNHKKISIPLTDNKSYIFLLDHLFIFDPKDKNNNNILIYNNNLDKIKYTIIQFSKNLSGLTAKPLHQSQRLYFSSEYRDS